MAKNPIPIRIIDKNKNFMKKKEIEAREENEPVIKSHNLRPPNHISKEAKKEWKNIIKLYKELNVPIFNDLDKYALEIYCETVVLYRNTKILLEQQGAVDKDNEKNKNFEVLKECISIMHKYSTKLLLDPVSRARIGAIMGRNALKDKKDDMEDLLSDVPGTKSK